jgi:type 2A phosphatase activator TIP41
LYLFECDLEDCGYTMAQARFRVMPDSWFVLVRYYLRVDNVVVRIFDTRMYHEFGTNFILREFKHQECDYQTLLLAGFKPTSEWMLS